MEQNGKDTLGAEKEQMNGQTEEVPQEMTASEEPAKVSGNNSDSNKEDISVNKTDENEEEEKEEEEDGLAELHQDDFQPSVEMSGQEYKKDENNRPVCRYNTVCYRKIKKGNTMQRIDEFESMLNV